MAIFQEFSQASFYPEGTTVTSKGEIWYLTADKPANQPAYYYKVLQAPWDENWDYTEGPDEVVYNGFVYTKIVWNKAKIGSKPDEALFYPDEETDEKNYYGGPLYHRKPFEKYNDPVRVWLPKQASVKTPNTGENSRYMSPDRPLSPVFFNLRHPEGPDFYWEHQKLEHYADMSKEDAVRLEPYAPLSGYSEYYWDGNAGLGKSVEAYLNLYAPPEEDLTEWMKAHPLLPFCNQGPQNKAYCGVALLHNAYPQENEVTSGLYLASWRVPEILATFDIRVNLMKIYTVPGWERDFLRPIFAIEPTLVYDSYVTRIDWYFYMTHRFPLFWKKRAKITGYWSIETRNYKRLLDDNGNPYATELLETKYRWDTRSLYIDCKERNYFWGDRITPPEIDTFFSPQNADKTFITNPFPKAWADDDEFPLVTEFRTLYSWYIEEWSSN